MDTGRYRPPPTITDIAPHSPEGLKLMGSALEGDIESALGPFAFHCTPKPQKRLHTALTLTTTLRTVLDTPMHLPKAYPIYLFATRVIAHALDYDVCVLHPDASVSTRTR